jgi:hypothetical protein
MSTNDELEFHLATLKVALRVLGSLEASATAETWAYTVQPSIAHAIGVCYALEAVQGVDDDAVRSANELADAIGSLASPEQEVRPSGWNEEAWTNIANKHAGLTKHFMKRGLKAWLFGKGLEP